MGTPLNTRLRYGAVGVREDLSNIIYNISPTDTPFMSGAGQGSCDNTLFEWQKDSLAAAAANQQIEGDAPGALAVGTADLLCRLRAQGLGRGNGALEISARQWEDYASRSGVSLDGRGVWDIRRAKVELCNSREALRWNGRPLACE